MEHTRHAAADAKVLKTFAVELLFDDDVNVDIWCYRAYSELPYVAYPCSFTEKHMVA